MKGQSATEQLITYGWAAMILVVIIGVLFYMGVINFSGSEPERCLFQSGFLCTNHRLYSSGGQVTVNVQIANKLSKRVNVTGIMCSNEPADPATGYPNRAFSPGSTRSILPEDSYTFTLTCYDEQGSSLSASKGTYKGVIYMKYHEEDSGFGGNLGGALVGDHMKVANIGGKIS